jgi:XTP/dITP diphosphohydrolase
VTKTIASTVVLASGNQGKLDELRSLLGPGFSVFSAHELGATLPEETGQTFEENAILKARAVSEQTGHIAIADDSGLEVDALDKAPGVYSARYAGPDATDDQNTARLLRQLADAPSATRTARFRSTIAIAFTPDDVITTHGSVEGQIVASPRGNGGFGYDPVFELPDGRTMAELAPEEKNAISHRGLAMRAAVAKLQQRLAAEVTATETS